jgi:hypothetical protein
MGDLPVLIELKIEGATDLAERVAALIKDHRGPVSVMSFDEPTVARLCQLVSGRPVGLLIAPAPVLAPEAISLKANRGRAMGCHYLAPHFSALAMTRTAVVDLPLATWTVREAEALELARKHGAAPIFEGISVALAKPRQTPI